MDIDKYYQMLEVQRGASPDQVKQAYKDLVNIWHPDRVSNNPRLKQKAEAKLKEINTAYEKVNSYLSAQETQEPENNVSTRTDPRAKQESVRHQDRSQYHEFESRSQDIEKPEPIIEQEQNVFSNLWCSISSAFRQMITDMHSRRDRDDVEERRGPGGYGMGKGGGRCMARGKGRGRGGGGMGRRGMGRGRGR